MYPSTTRLAAMALDLLDAVGRQPPGLVARGERAAPVDDVACQQPMRSQCVIMSKEATHACTVNASRGSTLKERKWNLQQASMSESCAPKQTEIQTRLQLKPSGPPAQAYTVRGARHGTTHAQHENRPKKWSLPRFSMATRWPALMVRSPHPGNGSAGAWSLMTCSTHNHGQHRAQRVVMNSHAQRWGGARRVKSIAITNGAVMNGAVRVARP